MLGELEPAAELAPHQLAMSRHGLEVLVESEMPLQRSVQARPLPVVEKNSFVTSMVVLVERADDSDGSPPAAFEGRGCSAPQRPSLFPCQRHLPPR